MASIKQKNTTPELTVFRALRKKKIYFNKHNRNVTGTPDVSVPKKKIAVFIDGDFWHGYRFGQWRSRLNSDFWVSKIERNMARDKRTFRKLRRSGWKVLRVWEHQLIKQPETTLEKITTFLRQ
jgi:DNA mismatch endonuclease (patch repair protein)